MSRYDVRQALRGQGPNKMPQTAEERMYKHQYKLIKSAEASNYDGSVETYNQIKMLATQLGIPIKSMKTSAMRKFGMGAYSLLDASLLGFLPDLQAANEGERWAQGIGTAAGMLNPFGAPAKLARGALGGLQATGALGKAGGAFGKFGEGFTKGFNRYGMKWPFGGGAKPGASVGGGAAPSKPLQLPPVGRRKDIIEKVNRKNIGGRGQGGPVSGGGRPISLPPVSNTRVLPRGNPNRAPQLGPISMGPRGPMMSPEQIRNIAGGGRSAAQQLVQNNPNVFINNLKQGLRGGSKADLVALAKQLGVKSSGTKETVKRRIISAANSLMA